MYVLVYKNQVILGPLKWSRFRFENALMEELEVEKLISSFPDRAPDDIISYNDDARVYPVREGEHVPHNPRIETRNGPFWTFTDREAVFQYRPIRLELEVAKSFLLQELAAERWKRETAGTTISIDGTDVRFNTDRETRNVIQNHIASGIASINWKVSNDNWVTLNQEQLSTVLSGIQSYVQTCFDWEKCTAETINNATTHEQLLDIVIQEPQQDQ